MSRLDIAQACASVAMLIFSIGAGVSAMAYRDQAIDAQTQLRDLRARLARQQSEAATRLAELTHQRDAKQAELDTQLNNRRSLMQQHSRKSLAWLASLSAALCGCASSPSQAPVGLVVQAPQVTPPPLPALVLQTPPRPMGYFQKAILDALAQ